MDHYYCKILGGVRGQHYNWENGYYTLRFKIKAMGWNETIVTVDYCLFGFDVKLTSDDVLWHAIRHFSTGRSYTIKIPHGFVCKECDRPVYRQHQSEVNPVPQSPPAHSVLPPSVNPVPSPSQLSPHSLWPVDTKDDEPCMIEKYQCTICKENAVRMSFNCGHVFCCRCTNELNESKKCPICRTHIVCITKLYF